MGEDGTLCFLKHAQRTRDELPGFGLTGNSTNNYTRVPLPVIWTLNPPKIRLHGSLANTVHQGPLPSSSDNCTRALAPSALTTTLGPPPLQHWQLHQGPRPSTTDYCTRAPAPLGLTTLIVTTAPGPPPLSY